MPRNSTKVAPAVDRLQADLQEEYDVSESGAFQFVNGLPITASGDHEALLSIVVQFLGDQTQMPALDGASQDPGYIDVLNSRLQRLGMSLAGAVQFANGQPVLSAPDRKSLLWIVSQILGMNESTNIGSATGGAGAGKVTFNPFSITRKTDSASAALFEQLCGRRRFGRPKW